MNPTAVEASALVDIRSITVMKHLPRAERIADFVKQIGNPYLFKCGKYTVSVKHAENGPSLEECLRQMMS